MAAADEAVAPSRSADALTQGEAALAHESKADSGCDGREMGGELETTAGCDEGEVKDELETTAGCDEPKTTAGYDEREAKDELETTAGCDEREMSDEPTTAGCDKRETNDEPKTARDVATEGEAAPKHGTTEPNTASKHEAPPLYEAVPTGEILFDFSGTASGAEVELERYWLHGSHLEPVRDEPLAELEGGLVYQRAESRYITQHFENNAQWRAAPFGLEKYLYLQKRLSMTNVSRGRTAYWVLFYKNKPETIISSCTTYIRDAIINVGKGVKSVQAVVITDIFTVLQHRHKGMATRLLQAVQDTLDRRQDRVEFSVIWSHNHPEFFDRLGWKLQPATTLRVMLPKGKHIKAPKETDHFRLASMETLHSMSKRDVKMSKCRIAAMGSAHTVSLQLAPTYDVIYWHSTRGLIATKYREGDKDRPCAWSNIGASWRSDKAGAEAWAWWTPDMHSRRLFIGRLATTRLSGLEAGVKMLLEMAAAEATQLGFYELVLWAPTEQVVGGAELLVRELGEGARAVVEERGDMVPCVRLHGGGGRAVRLVEGSFSGWV